jgi:inositol-phosphate phosphatase/L-galactose 1-phosphate phosphatase/histidinol-phosphatase
VSEQPTTNNEQLLAFAHRLVDTGGEIIRPYFGQHGDVEAKGDASPVTQADKAAEHAMRALIESEFPDHGMYGEEYGQTGTDKKYVWVIDPIDGTRAFIAGKKEWGTLIALCENGVPILGILNQPVTGERWVGTMGQPTTYNGQPIRTRPWPTLAQAVISTTSKNYFTPVEAKQFVALAEQCAAVIEDGDCYAYGLLARGARDIVVDAGLKPYDILALVPIIEGAGGKISGWDGTPVTLTHYANVIASGDASLNLLLN